MMEQTAEKSSARLEAVDLAKLAAAAAVVWIHVTNCDESRDFLALCRFAVPFFTCAAVYFVLQKVSSHHPPIGSYVLQRARRLYVPFIWWSVIYLAARVANHAVANEGSPIVISPAVLLNGTAHHLWFLPFIAVVSIITYALAKHFGTPREKNMEWWALGFVGAGLAVAMIPCPVPLRPREFPLSYFIDHAWESFPAAFLGAGLFCILRVTRPHAYVRAAVLIIGLLAIGWDYLEQTHPVAPHVTGASLLFFTMTQQNRGWTSALWPWAQFAFVIYLVHVLFVEALQTIANRFGTGSSLSADLSIWALAFVVSALIAKGSSRFRFLQPVFPR